MSSSGETTRLAITMGDPAGVGPEVIVSALPRLAGLKCVVLGHPTVLQRAVELLGADVRVEEIGRAEEASGESRVIACVKCVEDAALEVPPGAVEAAGGKAAYDALCRATRWALDGEVDAVVTAPLSKAALWKAGYRYPGHTELLGELCGAANVKMMLYLPPGGALAAGLGVVHVTLHVALGEALAKLTADEILRTCRLAADGIAALTPGEPKLAVCALNPHAGEEGLFGDEEQRLIRPAVEAGLAEGLPLVGPLPADTALVRAAAGEFDGVVAMYHDQGHIALKLLGMHRAVNITLGLPIIRTSVAHGTAGDRAWQGTADWSGMVAACELAAKLAQRRAKLHLS